MQFLSQEQLDALYKPTAAQEEETVQTQTAVAMPHSKCGCKDMQCIVDRHKTASALHNVLLILLILLLLKWIAQ